MSGWRRPPAGAILARVMARHVIPLDMETAPDLVWDDEAGTVEGGTGTPPACARSSPGGRRST